jgi:uncharacterized coiled-coil DUF342 family protein
MDPELVAYLDKNFRETSRQIEGLRTEMVQEFAKVREEMAQEFARVREETAQEFARAREETAEQIRHTRVEIEGLRDQIQLVAEGVASFDEVLANFKGEVRREFEDVRALIRPAYTALHDRVRSVEMWRERTERDPIELIRERFGLGKKPTSTS